MVDGWMMIANNLRTGEFDEEEDRFEWERERGGARMGFCNRSVS